MTNGNCYPTDHPKRDPEIRYLGDVQRLTLKPGDKLVVTLAERHVSNEVLDLIKKKFEEFVAGTDNKVIVLSANMKIGVLGKDE